MYFLSTFTQLNPLSPKGISGKYNYFSCSWLWWPWQSALLTSKNKDLTWQWPYYCILKFIITFPPRTCFPWLPQPVTGEDRPILKDDGLFQSPILDSPVTLPNFYLTSQWSMILPSTFLPYFFHSGSGLYCSLMVLLAFSVSLPIYSHRHFPLKENPFFI